MGRDPRRRQQTVAKKNARRQKRKKNKASGVVSGWDFGVSRSQVSTAPIYACLMTAGLFKIGIGHVIIARRLPTDEIAMGHFMVDVRCLGVKGALFSIETVPGFDAVVRKLGQPPYAMRKIDPAYARKLIERSVVYADGLGFPPDFAYPETTVVFGDINPDDCAEEFTFGRDGKPYYVSGPRDSVQKRALILATLQAHCGEGHYDYLVLVGDNPPPDDI